MAGNPPCMSDDGNVAIFTGTFFENGTSITVCQGCLQDFMVTMLESMTELPVNALIEAAREQVIIINATDDDNDVSPNGPSPDGGSDGDTTPDPDDEDEELDDLDILEGLGTADDDSESPATTKA